MTEKIYRKLYHFQKHDTRVRSCIGVEFANRAVEFRVLCKFNRANLTKLGLLPFLKSTSIVILICLLVSLFSTIKLSVTCFIKNPTFKYLIWKCQNQNDHSSFNWSVTSF
jgi:hypothetical protein